MSKLYSIKVDSKKNRIYKSGPPEALKLEALMTDKAFKISKYIEKFCVPEVYSFDKKHGILEIELFPNIIPIASLFPYNYKLPRLLSKSGEILSILHKTLELEANEMFSMPKELMDYKNSNGPIHGDLTIKNIQYDYVADKLVFLDWSFTPKFNFIANYGPQIFDVSWMVNSIFCSPPFIFLDKGIDRQILSNIFIHAYFSNFNMEDEMANFQKYLKFLACNSFERARKNTNHFYFLKRKKNYKKLIQYAKNLW